MYSVCKVTLLRFIIAKLYFFREIMSKKKKLAHAPSSISLRPPDDGAIIYFEVITNGAKGSASETFSARDSLE